GPSQDPLVTWDIISDFSFEKLTTLFQKNAPATWFLLMKFMNPKLEDCLLHTYTTSQVCTSVISELLFARNKNVNLLPLCRGISHISMKAHHSIHRIDSRLAHSVSYGSARNALVEMAEAKQTWLQESQDIKKGVVMDNIQRHFKPQDHHIGQVESRMVTGCSATAYELEDCAQDAFNLTEWSARRSENRRSELTLDELLNDLDQSHLELIAELHFLQGIVDYVPTLSSYRPMVEELFDTEVKKQQINPNRHTVVHPLGTNAENEVSTAGMKAALVDFFTQIGIGEGKNDDTIQFISGDGKSYEAMGNVKKHLSELTHEGPYKSFEFACEFLEIWHTKWTDLGRLCHGKWGMGFETCDPSTLGYLAKTISNPTPSDLKKPDFYANQQLIEVAVKSHIVRCWEVYYETDDIVQYFNHRKLHNDLPTMDDLREIARLLQRRYASSQAHNNALLNQDGIGFSEYSLPKTMQATTTTPKMDGLGTRQEVKTGSIMDEHDLSPSDPAAQQTKCPTPKETTPFKGDWLASNTILLLRDGIWWLEVCRAVQKGAIGCVWEVFKVWIITFAGSGHPHYTSYLLDMYCKIKYELPEATRDALFNNWLVNLQGKPGHFLELDLMQEHFNKWLEELSQYGGKEFDDTWYRNVLAPHVYHFLELKGAFENTVELAPHTKRHSAPHLDNEYRAVLQLLRESDLHRHHEGRDLGFHAPDDFSKGMKVLQEGKLEKFIASS
ncbi:hypothetical protein K474DRAFT_1574792, partial [Panus rudis PR-1116 ss-1]